MIREFLKLLLLNIKTNLFDFFEWLKVIYRYYRNFTFCRADLYLLALYFFDSPYRMNKKFLQERGEKEIHVYGETPLTTMELIANRAKIAPGEKCFELGCGRGRTCFWLAAFRGCYVVGIDWSLEFISRAEKVRGRLRIDKPEFRCEDLTESDFTGADVIYIYGTTWSDQLIEKLATKCAILKRGARIITVSYSLLEYSAPGTFEVIDTFTAPFLWGEAEVFVQKRKEH